MAIPASFSDRAGGALQAVILRLALGLAAMLLVEPALAGQLQVMPTRLGVTADAPTTTMFATNAETTDASYQVTVFAWTQHADGSDELTPTRDVLANPGIFTVKPGEQQIIRFGLRNTASTDGRNYRVVLEELPQPNRKVSGIQTLLRISVPIFLPAANPVTTMQWGLRAAKGGAQLVARNTGNAHVQVTGIQIGDKAVGDAVKCSIYVLPGISRAIPVHTARPVAAGGTYHVRIDTDQGPMTADLHADPAADTAL